MRKLVYEDHLPGGTDAKNLRKFLNRFDPKEVKMGIEDEKEHTKDPKVAAEIASDHLATEPHYYSKLKQAHIESTDVFEFNFHDLLEWDDDVPLGAMVQKVKAEPAKAAPKSAYQAKKERTAQNKLKRAEQHSQRKHLFRMDLLKSGKAEHEINASLAAFDKDAAPAKGRMSKGLFAKETPKAKEHHYLVTPLSGGREPKAEKQKVLPSSHLPPRIGNMEVPHTPVEEPSRAKNAIDNAFKSKKTDPRYSQTVK